VPSEEGIRHWFPPGDPVATAVAMLCILREDLLLELLGIVSDGLPKLDDNSTGYRRTYFWRNSLRTLEEIRNVLNKLNAESSFRDALSEETPEVQEALRQAMSADDSNPTNTPVRFGNIHPVFPQLFSTFSPQRLFTALDSTITEVLFFVPGTHRPATVDGFGAVFTDVNTDDSTRIEYFDVNGELLLSQNVLPGSTNRGSLSFLGVGFDAGERVFLVRITSGNRLLKTPARDVVVMDDFIYGEPQPLP